MKVLLLASGFIGAFPLLLEACEKGQAMVTCTHCSQCSWSTTIFWWCPQTLLGFLWMGPRLESSLLLCYRRVTFNPPAFLNPSAFINPSVTLAQASQPTSRSSALQSTAVAALPCQLARLDATTPINASWSHRGTNA